MLPNSRRFITIYRGYERPFWVSQGLLAIAAIFTLLIPLMIQVLIDEGLTKGDRFVSNGFYYDLYMSQFKGKMAGIVSG